MRARPLSRPRSASAGLAAAAEFRIGRRAHPEVVAWLERNQHISFDLTPVGSSWINQIETWFGIITRQPIRRGTFTSVKVPVKQFRDHIAHWNTNPKPFIWTATAEVTSQVMGVRAAMAMGGPRRA